MATTEVSICNSALIKLGADQITSLSDESKEAVLCNAQYAKIRDMLLYSHPWNFATTRVELTTNANESAWGGLNEFELPADYLRVIDLDFQNYPDYEWYVEGGLLYVSADTVNIKYIAQVTDPTLFSAGFVELLAMALANEISYALTQSATIKQGIQAEYARMLADMRSFDSQEGTALRVTNEKFLRVRQ